MSFDKDTRNALAKMVTACRRTLIEDVTNQLQETFGLYHDTSLPLDNLTHLTLDEAEAARALREQLDHFVASESGRPEERRRLAYDRLILEIAFTILNRLAALRLCEDRELVIECVRKGTASDGFRLFNSISGGALGSVHETYRIFLECMMDELALDLGVLFDRTNPQSAVFPTEHCLKDVLAYLNHPELEFIWGEDETIGWIYQYFNPPEERRAMREASQAPRNSRELAVRNQFFTPRYVVEFLTDNTLGRIWYEMCKGETSLVGQCRYMIRRPNEVFLNPGEETPVSQEDLMRRLDYIPYRPKKDPRDIKTLDPACGSAHFLLYDFDLMETIYLEAWNDPESPVSEATGHTLREDYPTLEEIHRAVPEQILRHNLHGIDIDLRAVQIAAFAIWLRAQRSWKTQGIKAKDRLSIIKSNIVCAEPMPEDEDLRNEFINGIKPRVLGQLIDIILDKMMLVGEIGSLLKIDDEIRNTIANARKQWLDGPKPEQQSLFPELNNSSSNNHKVRLNLNLKEIKDEEFWNQAEDYILAALKKYAEQADSSVALRRRFFAEDTARGFAFIDLCRKRYDVLIMNPPFGLPSRDSASLILSSYPKSCKNILCAFLIKAQDWTLPNSKIGAITDSTWLQKTTYEDMRRCVLSGPKTLQVLVDLGWGVLDDAQVAVSTEIIGGDHSSNPRLLSCDLRSESEDKKPSALLEATRLNDPESDLCFVESELSAFSIFPDAAIAYACPTAIKNLFLRCRTLDPHVAHARVGLQAGDTFRAFRLNWEIRPQDIGLHNKWAYLQNGGSFSPFFRDTNLLCLCENNFEELIPLSGSRVQNTQYYGRRGLTWGKRTDFIAPAVMPVEHVFSNEGHSLFAESESTLWMLLALMNSKLYQYLLNLFCGQHKGSGYVGKLPIPSMNIETKNRLEIISKECYTLARYLATIDEPSTGFISATPVIRHGSLKETLLMLFNSENQKSDQIKRLQEIIDAEINLICNIPLCDQLKISQDTLRRQPLDSLVYTGLSNDIDEYLRMRIALILSHIFGIIFGRWDIRIALDPSLAFKLPGPFDQLPVCPPGTLVGVDGLPAQADMIVSKEWLRSRSYSSMLPPDESAGNSTIHDSEYLLRIPWNGILVDDSGWGGGQPHHEDIIRCIRSAMKLFWDCHATAMELEVCQILDVSDIRDYFRQPSGFFQDHLKRYSKGRRKAPIYWPLSTASGSYTIWLYYPRLTDQTLYAVVNDYIEPKIAEIESALSRTEEKLKAVSGREANLLRDKINNGRTLLAELKDLRQEILGIAALPYKPDLNDGVIINAAPFHKLFRLRSWAEDTEEVWNKLERGEYDWSHLAYVLWPDRVQETCRKDRSIAIAHGLEDLFQTPAPSSSKGTRGKRNRRSKRAA